MDIDDFKTLNDMYGHDVGDEALRYLAAVVTQSFSDSAIIGRNGGDEFLAMLFGEDACHADELFDRLVKSDLGCTVRDRRYKLSMSIGFVECPKQVNDLKGAYTKADAALYAVKLSGKSGSRRYSPNLESKYRTRLGFSSRDLAENIPGGIMVHKADGKREILFANDELIRMLGCDNLSDFMEFTGGAFDGLGHALGCFRRQAKRGAHQHPRSGEVLLDGVVQVACHPLAFRRDCLEFSSAPVGDYKTGDDSRGERERGEAEDREEVGEKRFPAP
jgi:diguanylate cyclase (GGDEF)-like protein